MAPGVWFDFSALEPNAYISKKDIEQALQVMGVTVQPQSVALYHTGGTRSGGSASSTTRTIPA